MPTIIDSLIVTLGLDTSEYNKKRGQVKRDGNDLANNASQNAARVSEGNKKQEKSFDGVASSATKFFAIIGGAVALKSFIEQTIKSSAALNRLSENLNQTVGDISAWSNAAELSGGTAGGLQNTLQMLSKAQTQLQLTGESSLIPYFSALGVSMADAEGKARPVTDILLDLSDRLTKLDRRTAFNLGQSIGIDEGTLNLLLKGRREVENVIKTQKEHNAVTKQQAEESARLERLIISGKHSFEAFGRELLSAAMPALEAVFKAFSDFGEWIAENQEFVKAFLTIIAVGLAGIAVAITPINLTIAAVVGLAAAIAGLYQDYQVWKRGGESLIDWSKWEPGIKAAGEGISWLKDLLEDMVYRAIAGADVLSAVFDRDWERVKFASKEFVNGTRKVYGTNRYEGEPVAPPVTVAQPPQVARGTPAAPPSSAAASPAPAPSGDLSIPRGIRNNNPGNLNFAGQAGATKEGGAGGRFAVFGSQQEGIAALVRQLDLYIGRGNNTIRGIISKYAPPEDKNNTEAYISYVSKNVGVAPDQPLDKNNAGQIQALVRAIVNKENVPQVAEKLISNQDIATGYGLARGTQSAAVATPAPKPTKTPIIDYKARREEANISEPPTPAATPVVQKQQSPTGVPEAIRNVQNLTAAQKVITNQPAAPANNQTQIETNINEIKVITQATDAPGIARDMAQSMDFLFTSQANYSLT